MTKLERVPITWLDSITDFCVVSLNEPSNLASFRHSRFWNYENPIKYKKTEKFLTIISENGLFIYIDYKWNLKDYLKKHVPKKYHEMVTRLFIKEKKD
jgi:hypothetical protein